MSPHDRLVCVCLCLGVAAACALLCPEMALVTPWLGVCGLPYSLPWTLRDPGGERTDKDREPWPLWLRRSERHPINRKAAGLIPGQCTSVGCGLFLWQGSVQEATD